MSRIPLPKRQINETRAEWLTALLLLGFAAALACGLWRLHDMRDRLEKRFISTHSGSRILPEHRGSIWGRDGDARRPAALAMSSDIYHIELAPPVLHRENKSEQAYERQARALAKLLNMPEEEALQKLRSRRSFLYLKKNVPAAVAERVDAQEIPGVNKSYVSRRFYPDGMNFAHVLGHTDSDNIGRAGIEHASHKALAAADGRVVYARAGRKGAVSELEYQPADPGDNVYLTLDRRLQHAAMNALEDSVHKHRASSASAVLMDAHNGDILAMANYPSFNPHDIRAGDMDNLRNRALADQVEPGSVIKPFVAALALQNRLVSPDEIFSTQKPLQIGRLSVFDKHVREDLTLGGMIQKSSNVGIVQVAARAGAPALEAFYRRLGIGGGKVLQFREEAAGALRPHEQWRRTDFATHAYGYGFSVTLPQLLRAYSVFAGDGAMVQPRLYADGRPAAKTPVISPQVALQVRAMLEDAAGPDGTGRRAMISGYRVAGKTGTTFKLRDGKYDPDRRRVFFAGLAPASRPRYILVVMVDEPRQNGDSGGAAAAPVFRDIMRQALLFGGVRPDDGGAEQEAI